MTPYYDDGQAALYLGDVRAVLRELPAASVHCVVTSPPYYALRDYGIEPTIWGGDAECPHEWGACGTKVSKADTGVNLEGPSRNGFAAEESLGATCIRCGGWRGCLGLER